MNNKIRQQNVGYYIPFLNHGRNFLPRDEHFRIAADNFPCRLAAAGLVAQTV